MLRVPYTELRATLDALFASLGFSADDAAACARLFADASRDGVASHGLNRVPRFVAAVRDGVVDPAATATCVASRGAVERWDGRRAAGMLNAERAMARATALAGVLGVGVVALRNTNHWMRGGTYGWQAADAGMVGICWTNTMPNMPAWTDAGLGDAPRLGNDPLVIAVPRASGAHVVLDTAMSQFSFGAIESYRRRGDALPVPGGVDATGHATTDPAAIEATGRALPIGYWKGAGLAVVLDAAAALLSAGHATHEIAPDPARETGLSQTFVAIDPSLGTGHAATEIVDAIVADLHTDAGTRYPGERTLATRATSMRDGVLVDADVWAEVRHLRSIRR